jgi:hypothetical protein
LFYCAVPYSIVFLCSPILFYFLVVSHFVFVLAEWDWPCAVSSRNMSPVAVLQYLVISAVIRWCSGLVLSFCSPFSRHLEYMTLIFVPCHVWEFLILCSSQQLKTLLQADMANGWEVVYGTSVWSMLICLWLS